MDLLYTIGADASNFNQNVKGLAATAQTASNQVSQSLAQASQATDKLGGSAISASMKFQQMRSGISALRDGTLAFAVGGQRADMMLMAMGHHINSLVNETGSLGGAMKALGQSAFGVGGAILALTIAFEIYEKTTKKAKETTVDFVSTLDSLRQAQLKGQQDGQSEITRLQILYKATQDHTLSLADRNKAYDELEKKYPKWFTNADREATLLGQNKIKYDDLTVAVLAAANAKAYENQIGINSNRAFENDQKITSELIEQAKQRKIIAQQKREQELSTSGREGTGGGQSVAESRAVDAIAESQKKVNDLKTDTKKLNEQNLQLAQKAAQFEKTSGFKTGGEQDDKPKPDKKIKAVKDEYELLEKEISDNDKKIKVALLNGNDEIANALIHRNLIIKNEISMMLDNLKVLEDAQFKKFHENDITAVSLKPTITNSPIGTNGDSDLANMTKTLYLFKQLNDEKISGRALSKGYAADLKNEATAGKEIVRVFGQGLSSAFESALSGTSSFISAMGQFLTQLIEKLIAAAAAAAILAALLSVTGFASLGNFSSIFGALSGLGSLGKSTRALPQHASGGIFTTAHAGIFGEAGPEAIVTPKHLQEFAGVSGNMGSNEVTIKPFQVGPVMWFKQGVRSDKYINRIK